MQDSSNTSIPTHFQMQVLEALSKVAPYLGPVNGVQDQINSLLYDQEAKDLRKNTIVGLPKVSVYKAVFKCVEMGDPARPVSQRGEVMFAIMGGWGMAHETTKLLTKVLNEWAEAGDEFHLSLESISQVSDYCILVTAQDLKKTEI